ncbi:MAG: hypothetical protein ACLFVR_09055 [Thiohalospira sp.]
MDISDVNKYIDNLADLKKSDINELQKLTKKFPYFQAAHLILLLAMKWQGNPQFENQLTASSIHIPNRDLLYFLLNKDFPEKSSSSKEIVKEEPKEKIEKAKEKGSEKQVEKVPEKTESAEKELENKLLKNKNVRRKIKDSVEGMGENISETILSQIEFSVVKDDDELEYPPEIYFVNDERTGKNNIITIDARPGIISEPQKKDIFQIDESEEISQVGDETEGSKPKTAEEAESQPKSKDVEKGKKHPKKKKEKNTEYFDINNYADEDIIDNADDNDLIAKFIAEKPQIKPKEITDDQQDISQESTKEDDDLLTETLIKVYIAQGYLEKAIKSYEKLSLKYPEKSSYFADQIKKLKEQLNK